MSRLRIIEAGDAALVVELGDRIDVGLNARTVALADALSREPVAGMRDVVPTFASVTVYFDPLATDVEALSARITALGAAASGAVVDASRAVVDVPVCYGGDLGPDLPDVARLAGVTEAEVIERHSAREYRVFMIGFVPGFAYLGVVDSAIAVPRRSEPRTRVPAGSVAIAGELTGIYPSETPGGWHVIGRTPFSPFALDRTPPCLLRAGDTVRFHAVDRDTFARSGARGAASR
jgi:inhibitor of KinA